MTKIEWTEATWNPIVGCSVISPGCTNCYAMRMAHRLGANANTPHYAGTTAMSRGGPVWTGKLALAPDSVLTAPLRRRKPTTYFVNSMGDLFHDDVPDEWIDRVFATMALAPQHRFQVLTKRAARMQEYIDGCGPIGPLDFWRRADGRLIRAAETVVRNLPALEFDCSGGWPLPNVWLGVSAEDQARADDRIPHLLATPSALRFVSCEPLLGAVDLTELDTGSGWVDALQSYIKYPTVPGRAYVHEPIDWPSLDWVIVGGESGPSARPMHPDWARSLRDQCSAAGAAFFMKQMDKKSPIPGDLMIREMPNAR